MGMLGCTVIVMAWSDASTAASLRSNLAAGTRLSPRQVIFLTVLGAQLNPDMPPFLRSVPPTHRLPKPFIAAKLSSSCSWRSSMATHCRWSASMHHEEASSVSKLGLAHLEMTHVTVAGA